MEKKKINGLLLIAAAYLLFLCFTLTVRFCWVEAIGPEGSEVGYSDLNAAVRDAIGQKEICKTLSDLAGDLSIAVVCLFGALGAVQLLQRKSLMKVDHDLLILGGIYVLMLLFYVFFEIVPVNFRPILDEGALAASYPSSHTVLASLVLSTAALQVHKRVKNKPLCTLLVILCVVLAFGTVILRLLSGEHWFTDIVGGLLLTGCLLETYLTAGMLWDAEVF